MHATQQLCSTLLWWRRAGAFRNATFPRVCFREFLQTLESLAAARGDPWATVFFMTVLFLRFSSRANFVGKSENPGCDTVGKRRILVTRFCTHGLFYLISLALTRLPSRRRGLITSPVVPCTSSFLCACCDAGLGLRSPLSLPLGSVGEAGRRVPPLGKWMIP